MIEYVKEIAAFLIISQIILSIIPKKEYVKYVKLFLGTVLILIVFTPINNILEGSFDFDNILDKITYKQEMMELEKNINNNDDYFSAKAVEAYKEFVKQGVENIVNENNMICKKCVIELTDDKEEIKIKSIYLAVENREDASKIIIDEIVIDETIIDEAIIDAMGSDKSIMNHETNQLKNILSEKLGIEKECIYLNNKGEGM